MASPAASCPPEIDGVPSRAGVPLAALTSLRIGGPAARLYEPGRPEDLVCVLEVLSAAGVPWRLLGGGANTLAPDGGVHGAVVWTAALRRSFREGERLGLWAGVTLPGLVREACAHGLSGVEPLAGVPGHLGGGLAMNAGGSDWGLWEVTEEVRLWLPPAMRAGGPSVVRRSREEVAPAYRDGRLAGAVVLEARLRLHSGSRADIRRRVGAQLQRKRRDQPVTAASAGCAFRNPPGESAGRLLDAAGMKGQREGGAVVSTRHANFVVNEGGATAADVRRLLGRMEAAVAARFGIRLRRELVLWPEPGAGETAEGSALSAGSP